MVIDLNKCDKGDILISSQGMILEYVSPTPYLHFTYLDHVIKYIDSDILVTRTNDGFVFANRQLSDNNIVKIIKKQVYFREKKLKRILKEFY